MFSAGTRVYIHSSSISGKKLGPKRHSLGFVSSSSMSYLSNYIKDFPIKNQTFLFTPLKIVFTRYGKEKKERDEMRGFLNVTPLYPLIPKGKSLLSSVKEVAEILSKGELTKNPMWIDISMNYEKSGSVGLVLPFSEAEMSPIESKAWVASILGNQTFRALLTSHRNLPTLNHLIDYQMLPAGMSNFLGWIINAYAGGNPRRDLFRWAEANPKNMEFLILCLRCISSILEKRMLLNSISNMKQLFSQKKTIETNSLLAWYVMHMMENRTFIDRKLEIVKQELISTSLGNMIKNIHDVREALLTLKPKHA